MSGLLLAVKLLMTVGQKIVDLHHKGVDTKVANEMKDLVDNVHAVVDKYHKAHGLDKEDN